MEFKAKHYVAIGVAIMGVIGSVLGGGTLERIKTANTVNNNSDINLTYADDSGKVILQLYNDNNELRNENANYKESNLQLQSEIENLKSSNINSEGDNLSASERDELESQLNSYKESNLQLQSEIESLKSSYANLEDYNEDLNERNETEGRPNETTNTNSITVSEGGVTLASLDVFNDISYYWGVNSGGKTDTLGTDYSNSNSYIVVEYSGYAEYYINGTYTKLVGNIATHSSSKSNDTSKIQIYGDDEKLLYESPDMGIRTDPFSFELDITGVRFLRIEKTGSSLISLLLTDWTLS